MDATYAGEGQFQGRVAHGALLVSLAIGLGSSDVPQPATVAMVGTSWRFLRPVRPGDTVRARWRLARMRDVENPRWGLAAWDVQLLTGENPVLEGEVTLLVRRKAGGQAPARARPRRRGRGRGPAALPATPVATEPIQEPAPADTPPPARRRRRRRGNAGGGGQTSAPAAPEPAREPGPVAVVPKEPNAVVKALSRFRPRRRPSPAAPAPASTRSPSE
jgi:hypothetical protein